MIPSNDIFYITIAEVQIILFLEYVELSSYESSILVLGEFSLSRTMVFVPNVATYVKLIPLYVFF